MCVAAGEFQSSPSESQQNAALVNIFSCESEPLKMKIWSYKMEDNYYTVENVCDTDNYFLL